MDSLKLVLNKFFDNYKNKVNINKLISMFKISEDDYKILIDSIYELEKEGKIIGDNKGNYMHKPKDFYLVEGVVQKSSKNLFYLNLGNGVIINIPNKNLNGAKENDIVYVSIKKGEKHAKQKIGSVVRIIERPSITEFQMFFKTNIRKNYSENYYYIKFDENIIYIPDNELNSAYPGDLVSVQINDNKMGKVVEILERKNTQHVLEYKEINGKKRFTPIGTYDFEIDLIINDKETFDIGDRILVEMSLNNEATFIKKLNNFKKIGTYIESLFYDEGFSLDFSEKSKEEVKKINSIIDENEINKRVDLRNLLTFTIDGKNAKDLDDAVSLEFKDNKYYLYVHIADVTHYVNYGSALFNDAYLKGTSVYPANCVFPMLPKELSNGVCSLNPDEDKLTKTCKIELDLEGNVLDFQIFNSVINSNYRMTYGKVNDILTGKEIDENYLPYVDTINKMNELSNILQDKKIERGFLCFKDNSKNFDFNENGDIESVNDYYRGPAEYLIENFMLITNQLITSLAFYYELPYIYRNHEGPTIDQINKLKSNLSAFKKFLNTIRNISNPKILQKILLSIYKNNESLESIYFSKLILKCMNRAFYASENIGHYALALDYYGTFTSPIRRFPDLLNHFIIDKIITGNLNDINQYYDDYKEMCIKCNETQMAAEKFEQNIDKMLLREYASKYIGMELEAKIEFVCHNIVGIKTVNNLYGYIEFPKSSFNGNKVNIDGEIYEKGDKVNVVVESVKPNGEEIVFSIKGKKKELIKRKKVVK